MIVKHKLLSSLEKVFFNFPEELKEEKSGSMMKNEIFSFQFVAEIEDSNRKPNPYEINCKIRIESPINEYIDIFTVDYVPSLLAAYPNACDEDYITTSPGMLPDLLTPIKSETITFGNIRSRAVWIAVSPKGEVYGKFPITIKLFYEDDTLLAEDTYEIDIINASLPKQQLINTGWFHGDCLAVLHNVEIGSKKYYEILEKYLKVYVEFGHNMILTPIFTPALDTAVGAERPTNQLIDVFVKNGEYHFEFSKLDRWIDVCIGCGIEYFEMSHLFTQWGAEFTPKIMATVDGEYKRIFGWDVEATSPLYSDFLEKLMPKLAEFLMDKGVFKRCMFHISDEPSAEQVEKYEKAFNVLARSVDKNNMMDATSKYVFYKKGLIHNPVASIDAIEEFIEKGTKNLWAYYCCSQNQKVANRFMAMPSYRNRIIGLQLYKYDIKGFLHWGFNFWFSKLSKRAINPYLVTDCDLGYPSGDAYLVYPLNEDGEVMKSIRLYVFNEAMQDIRALKLLESLAGRDKVQAMLDELEGYKKYPKNSEYIIGLRAEINKKIKEILTV